VFRLIFNSLGLVLVVASLAPGQVSVPAINLSAPGTIFSRGVRGQAIPSINQFRPPATIGTQMSLEVARGSSLRGVAGGLEADLYDWRTRNNDARSTTLEYQRFARDYNAKLVITANIRGLSELDTSTPDAGDRRFYDTSIATLTKVAADWVRYTNVIAQTYRQGDVISNPQDQAILNSLVWTTGSSDTHATLPTRTEGALPKVTYWEIGNEPRVGLANSYLVNNSYTFLTPNHPVDSTHKYDYCERYASMTAAMKAVDATIKVGPAMQYLSASSERELLNSILLRQSDGQYLPVDFIGYHPYQTIYSTTLASEIESRLQNVYNTHASRVANIRGMISAAGRDPSDVELIASETNVSNWSSNGTAYESQMGHALGTVEEVFSFARLGLSDAHYWLWPGDPYDWTELPVYKAYEGLRDHMGDTLISTFANGNTRLYTTRDSASREIAVWGLNFSNNASASLQLTMSNLPEGAYDAKLMTLKANSGATTLFSGNLPTYLTGGPTSEVDWMTTSIPTINLADYTMNLPAATISLLLLTPIVVSGDYNRNGTVDASDYMVWRATKGQLGGGLAADGNGDNKVDNSDLTYWKRRFGNTGGSVHVGVGSAVLPEPGGGVFLVLGLTRALIQRRRGIVAVMVR
jgi:hypothetical protein